MIKSVTVCDQCRRELPIKAFKNLNDEQLTLFHQQSFSIHLAKASTLYFRDKEMFFEKDRQLAFCSYKCFHKYLEGNTK